MYTFLDLIPNARLFVSNMGRFCMYKIAIVASDPTIQRFVIVHVNGIIMIMCFPSGFNLINILLGYSSVCITIKTTFES